MSYMTPKQVELLTSLGKEPISLPAEIYLSGVESLQKMHCTNDACPDGKCRCGAGMHHLPKYQKTGTYWHPNLVRQRLREAEDSLQRAMTMRMGDTEKRKLGFTGDLTLLENLVRQRKQEWVEHVGEAMLKDMKKMTESADFMEKSMDVSLNPGKKLEATKEPEVLPTPKEDIVMLEEVAAPKKVTKGKPGRKPGFQKKVKDEIDLDAERKPTESELRRMAAQSATNDSPFNLASD